MNLRTLIYSVLMAIMVLSSQSLADIVTFEFDTIPDDSTEFSITDSGTGLTLLMSNATNEGTAENIIGNRDGDGVNANRGLTFDLSTNPLPNMNSIGVSFDENVTIVGYDILFSSGQYVGGNHLRFTVDMGPNITGLASGPGPGSYELQSPLGLLSGQAMTIAEDQELGNGYFILSSLRVEYVPEPSALLLLSMVGGLVAGSRRKRS